MGEWDKVFELRLHSASVPMTLLRNSIIANISFTVDLKGECVPSVGL